MARLALLLLPLVLVSCAPDNLQLTSVQVVHRHGARTALHGYTDEPVWNCDITPLVGLTDLVQTKDTSPRIYRKKYPTDMSKNLPGNCMAGQLTSLGAAMHEQMGSFFRRRYVDTLKFLPPQLDPAQMWFRSSDAPRTLASIDANMRGFYPISSTPVRPILDVEVREWDFDDIPAPDVYSTSVPNCPALMGVITKMRQNQDFIRQHQAVADVRASIMAKMNLTDDQMGWLWVGDNFIMRKLHGLPMPTQLTAQEVATTVSMAGYEFLYPYQNQNADQQRAWLTLTYGAMMGDIYKRMLITPSAGTPRYYAYSAHDTTIAGLISILGDTGYPWMPVASFLVFEVWRDPATTDPWVSIIYSNSTYVPSPDMWPRPQWMVIPPCVPYVARGVPLTEANPGAARFSSQPTFCPLTVFAQYAQMWIPKDRRQVCGLTAASNDWRR
ncbi:putative histidine phosphatase superfamily [Paratrimastix pyriformis]|uniref:Histidine phosphatase superfamily n=1 Tax=Paratrimastix pyriformis TaxID=342808 RepID=A0ABQ8UR72_9EUKA|nr:putative histidine phosphatase superfamily [Paratrimastix pyriformis]